MTSSHDWYHAKHDCLLARFAQPTSPVQLLLPAVQRSRKAVVQAVFDGAIWWLNGHTRSCLEAKLGDELVDARVVLNTRQEKEALLRQYPDVECIVLDDWFGDAPQSLAMEHRVAQLLARMRHCQDVLRVDFGEHASILSAWRWRNIRRIQKQWPFELQHTHQWLQSIDDRPWQEARMAYDLRAMAGAVLDIRAAYASAVEHMPFPQAGIAWRELRAGQRHENALHCIVWQPSDAMGRFYHPFWYSVQGTRALPAYGVQDKVHCWVLDEDLAWLARHGSVLGVYQSVAPGAMQAHPLAASVQTWRGLLESEINNGYKAAHKMRLVSSHSWTWQPRSETLVANEHDLTVHALEEYSSRAAHRVGGLRLNEDSQFGLVAVGTNPLDSGWYTPIAWIRMKLRSHLMRRTEHALEHGLDIAYVSVDGVHVRGKDQEHIEACHRTFVDERAPWWSWRVDKTFSKGIWFRPGSYALQDLNGQWQTTNLPQTITGRDWNLWCQSRGTLDARRKVAYWRRPNDPNLWSLHPGVSLNAQRQFRCIVRQELQR